MDLLAPDSDQLQRVYAELGVTPESLKRDVNHLQEWLSKQPHLPFPSDERRLKLCLMYSKNSLEDAKRLIDLYYTVRGAVPDFFRNRDPRSPELQQCARVICLSPMPKLTPMGCRIHLFHLMDPDPNRFHVQHYVKWSFMSGEVRLLEDISVESIALINLQGITLAHLSKFTLPLVRKYAFCGQNVFMTRLKEIHVINAPSFAEKILAVFKPFVKEKIIKRLTIHSKGYDQLLEFFPKDVLPSDYGGTGPSVKELHDSWNTKIMSYRDWFLSEDNVHADESKRPGKSTLDPDIFGMDGSFRKLELD